MIRTKFIHSEHSKILQKWMLLFKDSCLTLGGVPFKMNSTFNVSMNSITHRDVHSVLPGSRVLCLVCSYLAMGT